MDVVADLAGYVGAFWISSAFEHKLTHVMEGHARPQDHDTLIPQGCQSLPKPQVLLHHSQHMGELVPRYTRTT